MMQKRWLVTVIVTPKARENKVSYVSYSEDLIRVRVVEAPENNKANMAIVRVLSKYFQIKQNEVILVSGSTSKYKKFSLPGNLKIFQREGSLDTEKLEKQGYLFD